MDLNDLKNFLYKANEAGYATGEEKKWIKEADGSTTIPYLDKEWSMHDNFFGGEPYGGRLVVFFNKKAVWMMVYYGWVKDNFDRNEVYAVLREALKKMPKAYPFRGPEELIVGDFKYVNKWQGEVDRYAGTEIISKNGEEVYRADYRGGVVDK